MRDEARGLKSHVVIVSDGGLPFDVSQGICTKDIGKLAGVCGNEDILTMLAHPFRRGLPIAFDFDQFRPDLIDSVGRSANQAELRKVVKLASHWGMGLASASDSHEVRNVGRHCMDFHEDAKSVSDLTRMVHLSYYSLVAG